MLIPIQPLEKWVVFRSTATARVWTDKDQFIIPLDVQNEESYLSTDEDTSAKSPHQYIKLTPGIAVFCASKKPAYISGCVVFYLLST